MDRTNSEPTAALHPSESCPNSDPFVLLSLLRETRQFSLAVEQGYDCLSKIPDPASLKNCTAAANKLAQAVLLQKKILVVGDYDVDGISATALFIRFFKKIGYSALVWYIPDRFKDGYGLSFKIRDHLSAFEPGIIVTVDNGTNSLEEKLYYESQGIEVIITDHHLPLEGKFPAVDLVNPQQLGCTYPCKEMAGTTVAFLFLIELRKLLRQKNYFHAHPEPRLGEDLDLVALGTIADQMPLVGLNRLLVKAGFQKINHPKLRHLYPYLDTLKRENSVSEFHYESLAFKVIPLLNAAGRMSNAEEALDFMLADEKEVQKQYYKLNQLNEQRKTSQMTMLKLAHQRLEDEWKENLPAGLVVMDKTFHEGVTGIVANNLLKKYVRPIVVLAPTSDGTWKGSCRSPDGVNVLAVLKRLREFLYEFGGHEQAAGLRVLDGQRHAFKQAFEQCGLIAEEQPLGLQFELEILRDHLSPYFYQGLAELEPFGPGNPKPVFVLRKLDLSQPNYSSTLVQKWSVSAHSSLVLFKQFPEEFKTSIWDVTGRLQISSFRNTSHLEFVFSQWAPSSL